MGLRSLSLIPIALSRDTALSLTRNLSSLIPSLGSSPFLPNSLPVPIRGIGCPPLGGEILRRLADDRPKIVSVMQISETDWIKVGVNQGAHAKEKEYLLMVLSFAY